jgi:NAD-dependent DNA ligase
MSLEEFFVASDDDEIKAKIRQRRAQMLVHSCIYYELNDNIVSDHRWQKWADELEELQRNHPHCCNIGFYDSEFANWTGATGNHLPHRDPWVMRKAQYIIMLHRNHYEQDHVIP